MTTTATTRRRLLFGAVPLPAVLALPSPALAQAAAFPARPVTWVVPFAAGGITDATARLIAQKMGANLGQPVVVDNRPGAGGTIGTEQASRAPADGYTLLYGTQNTHAVAPLLYPSLRYDPERDFVPVWGLGAAVNLLVANPALPVRSVADLVAHAKAHPDRINYASTGIGTGQHMAGELFQVVAGVRMTHVPYAGFQQALNDLTTGRMDVMFDYAFTSLPHAREGRLRALAVTATERLAVAPEVPTIGEAGLPGAEMMGWAGVYAPARTPAPVVARLAEAVAAAMRDPAVVEMFDRTGTIRWADKSGEDMRRVLAEEVPRARELIARSGGGGGVRAN
ncbi:tripartite tricarboxylate transporter substrate binding protein [Craurococcus roseus]|uniref:Tripartite tricarboxylate transporter substrate binding protein n=1 Tax=Craurococcus roseus TaxID=77585 RepID=A0ABP3QGS6_9PROT